MVPTSALRETLILILFGIILVPIAAKRAQDARGYWQTFDASNRQAQLHHHHHHSSSNNNNNNLASTTYGADLDASPPIIQHPAPQNETLIPSAVHTSSPPRTVHFGRITTAETSGVVVLATAAPRTLSLPPPPPPRANSATVVEDDRRLHATDSSAAKVSDASSKGRWTLIWMGGAIATVAGLMSLC